MRISFYFAVSLAALTAHASAPNAHAQKRVAVTFDDLPGVSVQPCSARQLRATNSRLLAALKRENVTATALVTAGRCANAGVLAETMNAWLDAGHTLGNHTYSHEDLNRQTLAAFIADAERGARPIEFILAQRKQRLRYFRHPFLHAGDTKAKVDGFDAFLKQQRWQNAVVTIDNQEWVFAESYTRATRRNDKATAARIVVSYIDHLDASFAYYEKLSDTLFRRRVPQVLLLHINPLNADHFDKVAALLRRRGYQMISLEDALADPAYLSEDRYVGPRGLSWLQRWALARGVSVGPEPREPEWVARLYR